jgi:2'-5' RNA ligase
VAREIVRLDAQERGKRDGILQPAAEPRRRARQPGRDLILTGPIIVTALFGDGDNGWLQQLRRSHYPPERNRVPAHLTLFRQLPPSLEAELARRLAAAAAAPPPRATIAGIVDLGEGTALRVESEDLAAIRAELADAFHGLLTPQDLSPFRPHVTIQNKVEARDAKNLQQQLRASFAPRPLAIRALASWRYRDGPWEPLKVHAFRK